MFRLLRIRHCLLNSFKQGALKLSRVTRILPFGHPLNVKRVQYVWNNYVGTHHEYFIRVIQNVCLRDSKMRRWIESKSERKEVVVCWLAEEMYAFFDVVISQLRHLSSIKRLAYAMGETHAVQCDVKCDLTYWNILTLALIDELEKTEMFDEIHLEAWQSFLTVIFDEMIEGYFMKQSTTKTVQA